MIDDGAGMEVIVDGKVERRPVACVRVPCGAWGGPHPPMPEPVLRDDEFAVTTICGQVHILRK